MPEAKLNIEHGADGPLQVLDLPSGGAVNMDARRVTYDECNVMIDCAGRFCARRCVFRGNEFTTFFNHVT